MKTKKDVVPGISAQKYAKVEKAVKRYLSAARADFFSAAADKAWLNLSYVLREAVE